MKEYAIYPFEDMRITQRHDGSTSHLNHWKNSKDHSDKPWDEACLDGNRQYFVPRNDFIIEEILGLNTSTTNSVRLKSVNKLYIPYKNEPDYLCITLSHMNEETIKTLKKGQVIPKGSKLILEGKDGATAYHWHCTANIGKYYGFLKNSNGSWCFTYEKSLLPHEAFYVDTSHTVIRNSNGYTFKNVPIDKFGTPVARNELVDQIEILVDNLRARKSANGEILGFINKGVYNVLAKQLDSYMWCKVEENLWVAHDTPWSILYPKQEPIVEPPKEPLEQIKDEDSTNILDEPKTEPSDEKNKGKIGLWTRLIELIIILFEKIFKKSK